jgi:hypothetical protein
MGLKIFDRLQERLEVYRLKRRYNRSRRQSSMGLHIDDAVEYPYAASHDDLALPPPPSMADVLDGSVHLPARPSSAGAGATDYYNRPGSSSSRVSFAPGTSKPQDAASIKSKRASRWTVMGTGSRSSTLESTVSGASASSDDSNNITNNSDLLQVPSAGDAKKRRRQTMMQRMSAMYENPDWKKADPARGMMTPEQMQDWRIHAFIQ